MKVRKMHWNRFPKIMLWIIGNLMVGEVCECQNGERKEAECGN